MADRELIAALMPGALAANGFMGGDGRSPGEIIEEDRATLHAEGFNAFALGFRMEELTKAAVENLGSPLTLGGAELTTDEAMGWLPCPFGHPGLYPKTVVTLTDASTMTSLRWSALGAHLIKDHGFFGGKGSPFRLEPTLLARAVMGLKVPAGIPE